jgi:hypothetical protein
MLGLAWAGTCTAQEQDTSAPTTPATPAKPGAHRPQMVRITAVDTTANTITCTPYTHATRVAATPTTPAKPTVPTKPARPTPTPPATETFSVPGGTPIFDMESGARMSLNDIASRAAPAGAARPMSVEAMIFTDATATSPTADLILVTGGDLGQGGNRHPAPPRREVED